MTLNTSKCNHLTPLRFKGLKYDSLVQRTRNDLTPREKWLRMTSLHGFVINAVFSPTRNIIPAAFVCAIETFG